MDPTESKPEKKKPGRPRKPRPVIPQSVRLNIPTSTIWVSHENGDDATGVINNQLRPFKTLDTALSIKLPEDRIVVLDYPREEATSAGVVQDISPELNWEGERLRICMPVYRDVHPYTMKAVFAIAKKHNGKVGFDSTFGDATAVARNMLTGRFLKSQAEWLLFIDDDMIPPIGHAAQMKAWGANFPPPFSDQEVITRLVSQKKNLISAVCFDRYGKGVPRYKEAMENPKEAEYARSGPRNEVKQVEWVGAGCLLINRVVLEDIAKSEGWNIQSEAPLPFFGNLEGMGEDVSFCVRAKKAGHPVHLDMGCICGHAGAVVHWK